MAGEFKNEVFTDFSIEETREKMREAIRGVEADLGREWSMVIGGKRVKAADQFFSHNPSRKEEVIGIFQKADAAIAEQAMNAALKTFETWKKTSPEQRAEICFKAAEIMRKRRFELNAWLILEVGKSWIEADADVAEALDMLEFYGRETLRYGGEQPLTKLSSERNELRYIPLGVCVVIPPWNFPLAILGGMTIAAFATGNTVVLKPSSDAPGVAKRFLEILEEAGLPPGVVNLVTGPGHEVGDVLVKHPKTRMIAFTGSKEVGLRINEVAARTETGQIWIKRVLLEMGGKNAIIVDSECDLDDAATGVASSAYGYSGQKCSACSRAIVDVSIHDEFVERILEKAKGLKMGDVRDPDVGVGPVINLKALATIEDYIEIGKREGNLRLGGKTITDTGCFVEPTIITDIKTKDTIAQEEIFGPVLAVIKAQDFKEAIEIANDTEYGLTGSVYTKNPEKMKMAADAFHVGNLYFNRKSTGALVGVHPFGGFNMSGTDSKAGGRDYLLLFTQAQAISEKIS